MSVGLSFFEHFEKADAFIVSGLTFHVECWCSIHSSSVSSVINLLFIYRSAFLSLFYITFTTIQLDNKVFALLDVNSIKIPGCLAGNECLMDN